MDAVIQSFLSGFPVLIGHFFLTLAFLAIGVAVYIMITPVREVTLIRQDNRAAATSLGGAVVAMAIPLASAMASSVNALDIIVYGVVALGLQLACDVAAGLILRNLSARIAKDEMAAAITLVSIKLGVSVINAAALNA